MSWLTSRAGRSFASLRQRDFMYLTLSSGVLGLGQWFQQIGLSWLVLDVTNSAAQVGVISFIQGITMLISSPPGGVISDRFSRRNVIIWSTGLNVLQGVSLAVLAMLGMTQTWHLYAFAFVGGVAAGISYPVRQAFTYDLTTPELLTNAMTVSSMAQSVARVTGPPLAGVSIGLSGTPSAFFVVAVLNVVALMLTFPIRARGNAIGVQETESPLTSLVEGLKFGLTDRLILALLIACSVAPILVYSYVAFLPVFTKEVLKGGAETYGLLASGIGWGSIVGLGILAALGDVRRTGLIYFSTLLLYFVMLIAFARSTTVPVAMACLIGAGVFHSIMWVLTGILFQMAASNEMRGRVMSLYNMTFGLQPIGALSWGYAIERWGSPNAMTAFILAAVCLTSMTVFIFPELRKAEFFSPREEPLKPSAEGGRV